MKLEKRIPLQVYNDQITLPNTLKINDLIVFLAALTQRSGREIITRSEFPFDPGSFARYHEPYQYSSSAIRMSGVIKDRLGRDDVPAG